MEHYKIKDEKITMCSECDHSKYPVAVVLNSDDTTAENVHKAMFENMTAENYIGLFRLMEEKIKAI